MHIAIFVDQHVATAGGAQVSVRLQAKYLRKLGHTVTIVSPTAPAGHDDPSTLTLPAFPIGDGYRCFLPTRGTMRRLEARLKTLPPLDVVHVQADFWGAIVGLAYAKNHGIPSVLTCHTNIDHGVRKVLGNSLTALYMRWLNARLSRMVKDDFDGKPDDTWAYHARIIALADRVIAPTNHFARTLAKHGASKHIDVIPTGIDDDELRRQVGTKASDVTFLWSGRMSNEKRVMQYLQAIRLADLDARFHLYGKGALLKKAQKYVRMNGLSDKVVFKGQVSHSTWLDAVTTSHCVVQTSIGFETQGLTITEAVAFGTPVVLSDPAIAEDLPDQAYWLVKDDSVESLAATLARSFEAFKKSPPYSIAPVNGLRQSNLTAEIESVYKDVVGNV